MIDNDLILVRGLPGSGKTTTANLLAGEFDALVYDKDMFMLNDRGEYVNTKAKEDFAIKTLQEIAYLELKNNNNVIISDVFATYEDIKPFIRIAASLKRSIIIITKTIFYHSWKEKVDLSIRLDSIDVIESSLVRDFQNIKYSLLFLE